jgi:predicted TIM-barrel fold metal-dependent hydrolase
VIDGGVFIGRDPTIEIGCPPDELIGRLRGLGISRALAASFRGLHYNWHEGNDETLAVCRKSNGFLVPVAAVSPLSFVRGHDDLSSMRTAGFKAVMLLAGMQGWSWDSHACSAVVEAATEAELPVQVVATTPRELSLAARLVGESGRPGMVRWMERNAYISVADTVALAARYPKLLFDIGCQSQVGIIEWLVREIGSDRLFFSTSAPLTLEAASTFMLEAARLTDADRARISGGNLAALLGLEPPPPHVPNPDFMRLCSRPKIDTHWHTGSWNLIEPQATPADVSAAFDDFGIVGGVSSSIVALNDDLVCGNAETLFFIEREPRAYGLIVVNPFKPEESAAEVAKYAQHPRFVGLKTIQDFYRRGGAAMRLDDPAYVPLIKLAAANGLPLMAHLPGMYEAARENPGAVFVAAHSTWRFSDLAGLPNVYFDISTSSAFRRDVDLNALIQTAGSARVIFSSDGPLISPAFTLGKLASSGLQADDLTRIFLENPTRAFPKLRTVSERHQ